MCFCAYMWTGVGYFPQMWWKQTQRLVAGRFYWKASANQRINDAVQDIWSTAWTGGAGLNYITVHHKDFVWRDVIVCFWCEDGGDKPPLPANQKWALLGTQKATTVDNRNSCSVLHPEPSQYICVSLSIKGLVIHRPVLLQQVSLLCSIQ